MASFKVDLHIGKCVSLMIISQFTCFLRLTGCFMDPFVVVVVVVVFQVFCSAQAAPPEVSGHQESDQKRSD